jgi:hypothetical protein
MRRKLKKSIWKPPIFGGLSTNWKLEDACTLRIFRGNLHLGYSIINDTDEEFKASFYDITELESIKTELNLTAELVEVGDLHNDISEYCRRGTEYRRGQGARRRISNKHFGREARSVLRQRGV